MVINVNDENKGPLFLFLFVACLYAHIFLDLILAWAAVLPKYVDYAECNDTLDYYMW